MHNVIVWSEFGTAYASCACGFFVRSPFGPVIDRAATEHSYLAAFAA